MKKKYSPDRNKYVEQQDIPQQFGNDTSMNFEEEDQNFFKKPV